MCGDCKMPVSPLSISDWQKIAVIDHHNHQIILDPLHAVADTASAFIPEFCICSSTDAVAEILTNQGLTRRQLADMACAEAIADARTRLGHSTDNALQSSVLEANVLKLIAEKTDSFPQYDRGTHDISHELRRIRSLLQIYACEDTYYFSEVFVETPAQSVTVSIAPNLSCSEFLPPLIVTNKITHQFGYHPNACIDSLYMSLYLERINIAMRHFKRNIVIVMHNHLLVDDRKFSNIRLHYINPAADRYCNEKIGFHHALKFPDDYGLNYWFASTLQTRLKSASQFQNANLAVSAVMQLYNETIEKFLRTADFVYFNLISVAQSRFTGENCGKIFPNRSFEVIDGLILARDRAPLEIPDVAMVTERATSRYFPLPQGIQNILVDLKAYHFSSLDTTASLSRTWELVFDTLYPFILANDSAEILGKFNTFLLSFADKYAREPSRTTTLIPTSTVIGVKPLDGLNSDVDLSAPISNSPVSESISLTRSDSPAPKTSSVITNRKVRSPANSKGESTEEMLHISTNPKNPPSTVETDSDLDFEGFEAAKKSARYEIVGDVVLTNVIELRSRSRALRPRKRSASQNMVNNIKKSKIIEAFEKNHLSFVTTSDSRFFSDNSEESSDESFDRQITPSDKAHGSNSITRKEVRATSDAKDRDTALLEPLRSSQHIASSQITNFAHTHAFEPSSVSHNANRGDSTVSEGEQREREYRGGQADMDSSVIRPLPLMQESGGPTRRILIHPEQSVPEAATSLGYVADTSLIVPEVDMAGLKAASRRNPLLNNHDTPSAEPNEAQIPLIAISSKTAANANPRGSSFLDAVASETSTRARLRKAGVKSGAASSVSNERMAMLAGSKLPTFSKAKNTLSSGTLQSREDTHMGHLTLSSEKPAETSSTNSNAVLNRSSGARPTLIDPLISLSGEISAQLPDTHREQIDQALTNSADVNRELFLKDSAARLELKLAHFRVPDELPRSTPEAAHSAKPILRGGHPQDLLQGNEVPSTNEVIGSLVASYGNVLDNKVGHPVEASRQRAKLSVDNFDVGDARSQWLPEAQESSANTIGLIPSADANETDPPRNRDDGEQLEAQERYKSKELPRSHDAGIDIDRHVNVAEDLDSGRPYERSPSGVITMIAGPQNSPFASNEALATNAGDDVNIRDAESISLSGEVTMKTPSQIPEKADAGLLNAIEDTQILDNDEESMSKPSKTETKPAQKTTSNINEVIRNGGKETNDPIVRDQLTEYSQLKEGGGAQVISGTSGHLGLNMILTREVTDIEEPLAVRDVSPTENTDEAINTAEHDVTIPLLDEGITLEAITQHSLITDKKTPVTVEDGDINMHDAGRSSNHGGNAAQGPPQSIGNTSKLFDDDQDPVACADTEESLSIHDSLHGILLDGEGLDIRESSRIIKPKAYSHDDNEDVDRSEAGEAPLSKTVSFDNVPGKELGVEGITIARHDSILVSKAVNLSASSEEPRAVVSESSQSHHVETPEDVTSPFSDASEQLPITSNSEDSAPPPSLRPLLLISPPLVLHMLLLPLQMSSKSTSSGSTSPQASKNTNTPTTPTTEIGRGEILEATAISTLLVKRSEVDHLIRIDPEFVAQISRRMSGSAKNDLEGRSELEREEFFALKVAKLALSAPSRYQKSVTLPLVLSLISKYYFTAQSLPDKRHVPGSSNASKSKTTARRGIASASSQKYRADLSDADDMEIDTDSTFIKTPSQRPKVTKAGSLKNTFVRSTPSLTEQKPDLIPHKSGLATLSNVRPIESSSFMTMPLDKAALTNKRLSSFLRDLDSNDSRDLSDNDSDVSAKDFSVASQAPKSSTIMENVNSRKTPEVHQLTTQPSTLTEKKDGKIGESRINKNFTMRGLQLLRDLPQPSSEPTFVKEAPAKRRNILAELEDSDIESHTEESDTTTDPPITEKIPTTTPPKPSPEKKLPVTPREASPENEKAIVDVTRTASIQKSQKDRQLNFFRSIVRESSKSPKTVLEDTFASRESSKFKPKTNSIAKPFLIRNGTKLKRDSEISQPNARSTNPKPIPAQEVKTVPIKRAVNSFIDKLAEKESSSDSDLA